MNLIHDPAIRPNPTKPDLQMNAKQRHNQETLGDSFANMLADVNDQQLNAEAKKTEFLTSPKKDLHGTMIAMEKAEVSLKMMMQVRNKMVKAYEEVMRMQV